MRLVLYVCHLLESRKMMAFVSYGNILRSLLCKLLSLPLWVNEQFTCLPRNLGYFPINFLTRCTNPFKISLISLFSSSIFYYSFFFLCPKLCSSCVTVLSVPRTSAFFAVLSSTMTFPLHPLRPSFNVKPSLTPTN